MKFAILALTLLAAGTVWAADARFEARLAPAEIALGEASDLTITASGGDAGRIEAPVVPGLRFTPVSQSRRVEAVNGIVTSTFSLTYRVTAEQPGTYVIAGVAQGVKPLVLKVTAATSAGASQGPPSTAASSAPAAPSAPAAGAAPSAGAAPPAGAAPSKGEGTAFVRLTLPQHPLYVGQSVPIEIEVGTHDGVVASLNGLPALNGDAFTLEKLAPEPERRTEEVVDGKPFTVFTWHGVLAAIKPGSFSLRMETPLTVRVPVQRSTPHFADDSTLDELFNDPAFQGFFGGTTERDITVSSPPADVTVLDLPTEGRPRDFTGAVGQFQVTSELASHRVAAGDPVTLRLKVSGEGSFDRVDSAMLGEVGHFKTYRPTSRFESADGGTLRGDKVFEQPIVATEAGRQSVPALSFSYFDPVNRRYETARTEPIDLEVLPAAAGAPPANPAAIAAQAAPAGPAAASGVLRPDHAPTPGAARSLIPLYYQRAYAVLPAAMMLAFPGAWLWLSRREGNRGKQPRPRRGAGSGDLLADMERAAAAGNAQEFFKAAQALLQQALSSRWNIPREAVTLAEVDQRLGDASEVRRLFALADEARYAGRPLGAPDLAVWRRCVLRHVQQEPAS